MEIFTKLNILILMMVVSSKGLPLLEGEDNIDSSTLEQLRASVNDSNPKNLYNVKVVVYEVGVLTEVDSNESDSEPVTHERVDLTFFDDHTNGSHIDLGTIPLPVQTNVTGQVLTGVASLSMDASSDPNDIMSTLPIKGTIVNITHSDTSYFQLGSPNHPIELTRSNENNLLQEDKTKTTEDK